LVAIWWRFGSRAGLMMGLNEGLDELDRLGKKFILHLLYKTIEFTVNFMFLLSFFAIS
jgi:thiamine transporter ThiT